MDELPDDYTAHNLPLVLLSGLGQDGSPDGVSSQDMRQQSGTSINMQSAGCEGDRARELRQQLLLQDGSDQAWNAKSLAGPTGSMKYAMRPIGRVGMQVLLECLRKRNVDDST